MSFSSHHDLSAIYTHPFYMQHLFNSVGRLILNLICNRIMFTTGPKPAVTALLFRSRTAHSYTLSGLEEGGTYFFAVSAVDTSGNESGYSEEISKQIASSDSQLPIISITSPTSDSTYSVSTHAISLAGTASDRSRTGPRHVDQLQRVAAVLHPETTTWSIDNIDLVEGDNIITVTATRQLREYCTRHSHSHLHALPLQLSGCQSSK